MSKSLGEYRDNKNDARVKELFVHLRAAIDLLEQFLTERTKKPTVAFPKRMVEELSTPEAPRCGEKLSYSIKEVAQKTGLGRSSVYKAVGDGRLRTVKYGSRTLVRAADLNEWLQGWSPSHSQGFAIDE